MHHFFHYIAEQLSREHTCILPGAGVFTLSEIPAYWSAREGRLYPPRQKVRFERNAPEDTAASLVTFIACQEQLLESVVAFQVEKFVNSLKQQLAKGEKTEMPGMGYLETDASGNISFSPYGEGVPAIEPIAWDKDIMEAAKTVIPAPAGAVPAAVDEALPEETAAEEAPPEGASPETDYPPLPEEPPRRSAGRWWWIPVTGIAALAAVFFFLYREQLPGLWRSFRNGAEQTVSPPVSQPAPVADNPVSDSTVSSVVPDEPAATQPANDSIRYHIVIAVFADRARAEKQYDKLRGWGHPVDMLVKDSGNYLLAMPFTSLPADTTVNLVKMMKNYGPHSHIIYE